MPTQQKGEATKEGRRGVGVGVGVGRKRKSREVEKEVDVERRKRSQSLAPTTTAEFNSDLKSEYGPIRNRCTALSQLPEATHRFTDNASESLQSSIPTCNLDVECRKARDADCTSQLVSARPRKA